MSGMGEQARFFGKLAALMDAGVPLLKSFEVAAEQVGEPELSDCLARILDRAYGGNSLTDAFEEEREYFSAEVRCLIRFGEEAGDLETKAASIADGLTTGVFGIGGVASQAATPGPADVDGLIAEASEGGVREIHLEPEPDGLRIRHRSSDVLSAVGELAPGAGKALIAAVRVKAGMSPDSSTGEFLGAGRCVTVGSCAYEAGEGLALVLTDLLQVPPTLEAAGLEDVSAEEVRAWLTGKGGGLVGITGHRGSGRLATAASVLREIGPEGRKVLAVDPPPALRVTGVGRVRGSGQTAVASVIGQAPDAVLLFRLPEGDDLEAALELASRGSLVLSVFTASGVSEALSNMLDCAGGRPSVPVAGVTWQRMAPGAERPFIEVMSAS